MKQKVVINVAYKRKTPKCLWVEISRDGLELPIVVAGSARELARLCNVKPNAIYSNVCAQAHGRIKDGRFRKIELEEGEEI